MISQRQEIDPTLRRQILFVTAGVVLSTILVNGATMGKVLSALGFSRAPLGERLALLTAKARVLADVKSELSELGGARELATVPWHEVMANVDRRCVELEGNIEEARAELAVAPKAVRAAGEWTRVLSLERQAYWEAFTHGTLGAAAVQLLSKEIDLQLDRLGRGDLEAPEERLPKAALRPTLWERFGGGGGFERLALLYDLARAQNQAAGSVLTVLDELGEIDATVAAEVRRTYRRYLVSAKERIEDVRTNLPEVARAIETRLARRIELNLERDGIHELVHRGVLNEAHAELEQGAVEVAMRRLRNAATRVPLPETAELVAQAPLFRGLDDAALAELAEVTEEMVLPKGDTLFKTGDAGDSAYVIARGAVHVVVKEGDKDVVVDALGGGEFIGEMALLTGAPRSATVRAATTVTLGRIRRDSFQHLIETQPALRDAVWQEVGQRGFDNALRGTRFGALDRDTRRDWLERATRVELAAGDSHVSDPRSSAVFVLLGAVHLGDEPVRAGNVISLEQRPLRADQAAVVYLLPELSAAAE
jgi:CRP-like cAMP-binding protein